jgi:superoxide dismutase
LIEYAKEYYSDNNDSIKKKAKEYRDNNRKIINKNIRERKKSDPLFKLRHAVGNSILKSIKKNGYAKNSKTTEILGCTYKEFKKHIESKFESWMMWENHGKYNGNINFGWDIDHIVPICSAKTEEEILKLNHYTNLQPLCSYTNRYVKGDKLL